MSQGSVEQATPKRRWEYVQPKDDDYQVYKIPCPGGKRQNYIHLVYYTHIAGSPDEHSEVHSKTTHFLLSINSIQFIIGCFYTQRFCVFLRKK